MKIGIGKGDDRIQNILELCVSIKQIEIMKDIIFPLMNMYK